MRPRWMSLALLALLTARPVVSLGQELVTLTPPYAKLSTLAQDGRGIRGVAGQSFRALGPTITSFGFFGERFIDPNREVSAETAFQAELWRWEGGAITGSALFTSDPFFHWSSAGWFDFSTGPIGLTTGGSYIALIRELDGNLTPNTSWLLGGTFNGALYPDGARHFGIAYSSMDYEIPVDVPQFWIDFEDVNQDLAFRASFSDPDVSTVPEPGMLLLLGTGVAGIAARRRLRLRG